MTPVLFHFLTSEGAPIALARVEIRLTRSDYEEELSGVLMPRQISLLTGLDGKVLQSLMPCNTRYHVTVYDSVTDAALHYHFYVPVMGDPEAVVRLQDLIVDDDVVLGEVAYDEAALLQILNAKAQTLSARDTAVAAAESMGTNAEDAAASAAAALVSQIAAGVSAGAALVSQLLVEGAVGSVDDSIILAENYAASALASKDAAALSAAAALTQAGVTLAQATAALASADNADASETAAVAARDTAVASIATTVAARDITVAAKDVALVARDVTLGARDTAVTKADQLAAQLFSFNEIYIGKFATAPTVDGNGGVLKVGAIYENTVEGKLYQWESDLAWHAYDEESQGHLANAVLSATAAAGSAVAALASQTAASTSEANALAYRNTASGHVTSSAANAAAALASKTEAETAETNAETASGTATTKAAEAAQSAADAAASAALSLDGQLPSNWAETDPEEKTFIQNKPVLAAVATSGAKADVGLGNVDNTSDAAKPVSTAGQLALDLKQSLLGKDTSGGYVGLSAFKIVLRNTAGTITSFITSLTTATRNWTFPDKDGTVAMLSDITGANSGVNTGDETLATIKSKLGITTLSGDNTGDQTLGSLGAQAALGYTPENVAAKGAANGYAPLGADTKIPSAYLPGYVDDVIEVANYAALPGTGSTGVMYVTINDGIIYRWSGSTYIAISASPGTTDAVPEGATNLYYTESRVRNLLLTGLNLVTGAAVVAADTVLAAFAKLQVQINNLGTAKADKAGGAGSSGTWPISVTGAAASTPLLSASGVYAYAHATLPTSWPLGETNTFVQAADGWQNFGTVVTTRSYTDGGGTLQMYTPYSPTYGGSSLKFRMGNYDVTGGNSWTAWHTILDNLNFNTYAPTLTGTGASGTWSIGISGTAANATLVAGYGVSVSAVGSTVVARNGSGYLLGNYINMTDEGSASSGTVTAIITKRGDDYYRSTSAGSVKAFLAIDGSNVTTYRADISFDLGIAKELRWKNYGNGHTIFDASAGTSPTGSAVNTTNPTSPWSATYPTLMGWNGSITYGVRVDSCRLADNASALGGFGVTANAWGNYVALRDGSGNIYAAGFYGSGNGLTGTAASLTAGAATNASQLTGYVPATAGTASTIALRDGTGQLTAANFIGNLNGYPTAVSATGSTVVARDGGGGIAVGAISASTITASGDITAYSDETLKANWRALPADFIERWSRVLHGTYDRKDVELTQTGIGAQHAREVIPEWVAEDEHGILSFNYGMAGATASVALAAEVVELKRVIADLVQRINTLETK